MVLNSIEVFCNRTLLYYYLCHYIVVFATTLAHIAHGNFGVMLFCCFFVLSMLKQIVKEICILRVILRALKAKLLKLLKGDIETELGVSKLL